MSFQIEADIMNYSNGRAEDSLTGETKMERRELRMAKKGGSKSGGFNPFGGLFDFNRDGKTDFGEQFLMHKIFEESTRQQERNLGLDDPDPLLSFDDDDWRDTCEDGSWYGIDPWDYKSEDKYNEALEYARYGWRDVCEDGSDVGINPYEFDTEEEYEEALNEDRELKEAISVPVTLTFTIEPSEPDPKDTIKRSDYPNKRQYDAACRLCEVKQGNALISEDSDAKSEIEKCEFILKSDSIAAKYLTVFDGFLFSQAVKDNFQLPVEVPDEDEKVITYFDDLFMEIAEEDPALAVRIWAWCIKEFGPYKQYMRDDWTIYNAIISSTNEYPKRFLDLAIKAIGAGADFRDGLITHNPQFPFIASYIARALEIGCGNDAEVMFHAAVVNPVGKSKAIEELIDTTISDCSNWEELETMEAFQRHILPQIKEIDDKRIQRLLPQFVERINYYIDTVESSSEKYRFSRRFAWRKNCADGTKYGLDPLNYDTENEYNDALQEEKFGWRRWHTSDQIRYGIDPNAHENEKDYLVAVNEEEKRQRQQEREEERRRFERRSYTDPLAQTDKTGYRFCGVTFSEDNSRYYYRTDDETLDIGDKVIVPVGNAGKEAVAEIVCVEKHRRMTAPYPVDKAKFIKCRYEDKEQ